MKPVPKEIEAEKDQKTKINYSIRYGENVLRFWFQEFQSCHIFDCTSTSKFCLSDIGLVPR